MNSRTTPNFWDCYKKLPAHIQESAKKSYAQFVENPNHPSLRFKKIFNDPKIYSAHITQNYRTLGVKKNNTIIWYWIGSHEDYEHELKLQD